MKKVKRVFSLSFQNKQEDGIKFVGVRTVIITIIIIMIIIK
jgi:hypothetical protein